MRERSFDPNAGDATLVYRSSDAGNWERPDYSAIRAEREADMRERELGQLMRQRHGVCG